MQRFSAFYSQQWYVQLPTWQQELVRVSLELYSREERMQSNFADYAFLVFPMAKAYEGFLKKCLYDSQLISHVMYMDRHFRIGRALNPDLRQSQRDENWFYPQFEQMCGGEVARNMWETWVECRNQLFHYFPDHQRWLSFPEAGRRIEMIAQAMEMITLCQSSR